jgi:hypothetical protein
MSGICKEQQKRDEQSVALILVIELNRSAVALMRTPPKVPI